MSKLAITFAGAAMKNPVAAASGTFGMGREYNDIFPIEKLGGVCSKGLTLKARPGNTGIRIWETPSGIMNSVGLENPGVMGFIEHDIDWVNSLDICNIVNVGGHSIDDYLQAVEILNNQKLDILELNISCPNVKEGGMNFGVNTAMAADVVRQIRKVCKHTLMVKLSPNAENIVDLAKAIEAEGADALSLINTVQAMAIDIKKRKAVFDNGYAGLSGPAVKPIALRMVHQVCHNVQIPVMGLGGISTWQDAVEFIMAGASAVQVGTATFMEPTRMLDIIDGMEQYCADNGLSNIMDVRGCV